MEQYIIKGGNPLVGEVEIGGAKNAALAILAAAIMTDETVLIENLPDVNDVNVMLEAISEIGATVQRIDRHTVKINGGTIGNFNIEYDYIKKIRASYYLLGALLGKYRRAEVALPGGCNIGSRPIDQHLKGFRALGADVDIEHGKIVAEADRVIDLEITLRRTVQYGLKQNPSGSKEWHYERSLNHLLSKYAEGGYLKLWFENSKNGERLKELRALINNRKQRCQEKH